SDLAPRRDRRTGPRASRPRRACGAGAGGEPAAARGGIRHQHAGAGARHGSTGGRRRRGERPGRRAGIGGAPRRRAPDPRPGRRGTRERGVTANRLVTLYSRGLAIGGPVVLLAVVGAYGVDALIVRAAGVAPGLHVEMLLPLVLFGLAYFGFSRLLFYFALTIRGKLERDERMLIFRYECISFGATIIAAATLVGTVVFWPPEVWLIVAALLTFLGLLFKTMLEEAISAEELNKIHAVEAVITSNISLEDSFARIERLAHRLVDWGDFRIYRRQDGGLQLAYRGAIG